MDVFGPKYDIFWLTSSHVMDAFEPMTYFVPCNVWMHLGLSPSSVVPLHSQNSETGFIWVFTPYLAYFVPCDAFMDAFQPSESYEIALIFSHKTIFCPCQKMVTSDHKRGPQLSSGESAWGLYFVPRLCGCIWAPHTLLTRKTSAYFVPAPFEGSGFIWANRLTSSHVYGFIWVKPSPLRGGELTYFVPFVWIHFGLELRFCVQLWRQSSTTQTFAGYYKELALLRPMWYGCIWAQYIELSLLRPMLWMHFEPRRER